MNVRTKDPEPNRPALHLAGAHSQATFSARQRFLDLMGETAKHVIDDLQQKALTPLRMLQGQVGFAWVIADAIASRGERTPFEIIRLKAEGAEGSDELLEALEAWQKEWRLRAPWIENAVLQALVHWSRHPETVEEPWPPFKQVGWTPKGGDPPSLRAYNPYKESRSAYKTEMLVTLDAYAAKVEQDTRERLRAEDWPKKTSQGNRPSDQHLRWCLRYLIGETQYKLSFRPEGTEPPAPPRNQNRSRVIDEGTIRRGIKKAAEQLGLVLP